MAICQHCGINFVPHRKSQKNCTAKCTALAAVAAWRKRNPEKMKAYAKERSEYNRTHAEENTQKRRTAWVKDLDKSRAMARAKYAARRKHYAEYQREWRHRHPDKAREAVMSWRAKHPEHNTVRNHRRKARLSLALGRCNTRDMKTLREILGSVCLRCGRDKGITWDHVIPLSRGGSDGPLNKQPLCVYCNTSKHNRNCSDYRTRAHRRKLVSAFQMELL